MKNRAILLCCSVLFCHNIFGQILRDKGDYNKIKQNVSFIQEKILFDNETPYIISIKEEIQNKDFGIDKIYAINNALEEITLSKNEYPLSIYEDKLYTVVYNYEIDEVKLSVSLLNQEKQKELEINKSLLFGSYTSFKGLENGDIIVREGSENGGFETIGIYSKDLKLFNEFKPFNNESNIIYGNNKNYIVFVSQIFDEQYVRIGLYSAFMNREFIGSKELTIEPGYNISAVIIEGRTSIILLTGEKGSKLIAINDKLEVLYTKELLDKNISNHKLISHKNKFLFSSGLDIYAYDIYTGKKIWNYTNNNSINNIGELFLINDDYLAFLSGQHNKKGKINNVIAKVISLDEGNVEQIVKLGEFEGKMKLAVSDEEVMFYSNKKIRVYGKE